MENLTQNQITELFILYKTFDLTKGVEECAKFSKAASLLLVISFEEGLKIVSELINLELKIVNSLLG